MDSFEYMHVSCEDCQLHYNTMAFDGCHYFFTVRCQKKIVKTDINFCIQENYETCREYDSLCYDSKDCCFWATSIQCPRKIYKLNCSFLEVDSIFVGSNIIGISYDCCDNKLLAAFACEIVEVDKCSGEICVKHRIKSGLITAVLSICPGYIFTVLKDNMQHAYTIDYNNNVVKTCDIPSGYLIRSMIFNPGRRKCKCGYIYFFAIKRSCYPFILSQHIKPSWLGFCPCECNYRICEECCGCCPKERCDMCCNHEPCLHDSCTSIIESIAQVEMAIARILNAEGAKIQKVVSCTDDIDQILCVNREVNHTIVNATHLEQVLYDKLASIMQCCDSCNK